MTAAVMTFDTFSFYSKLKGVGFSEDQAEAIAEIQKQTATAAIEQARHDYHLDDLATKRDLKELELQIAMVRKDVEIVKADLRRDIETSKAELSRTILTVGVGVGLAQMMAIFFLFMRMAGKA
jgi:hypothetical protein